MIQALLSLIRLLSGLIAVDNGLEMWLLTTVDLFVVEFVVNNYYNKRIIHIIT